MPVATFTTTTTTTTTTTKPIRKRIVLPNHIVTASITTSSSTSIFTTCSKKFSCRIQIYSTQDNFTVKGNCTIKPWNGWKASSNFLALEAIKWAADARALSSCGGRRDETIPLPIEYHPNQPIAPSTSTSVAIQPLTTTTTTTSITSIGRNEKAATTAHLAYRTGSFDYPTSLQYAREALKHWPENIQYRLDLARALLLQEKEQHETIYDLINRKDEGLSHCKTVVSKIRRTQRALRKKARENKETIQDMDTKIENKQETDTDTEIDIDIDAINLTKTRLSAFVADAYQLIGDAHVLDGRKQKNAHAISAYTLALLHDSNRTDCKDALADCMARNRDSTLQENVTITTNAEDQKPKVGQTTPNIETIEIPNITTLDIEEILSSNTMLSSNDRVGFSCTMCGECCRHADYIFLSPVDIWRLLRADVSIQKRILWTNLKRNEKTIQQLNVILEQALQWTTRSGLPICYLSPKKMKSRCTFAYPLYRKDTIEGAVENGQSDLVDPLEAWAMEEKEKKRQEKDAAFVPVSENEYDFTSDDLLQWEKEATMEAEEKVRRLEREEEQGADGDNEDDDDEDEDEDLKEANEKEQKQKEQEGETKQSKERSSALPSSEPHHNNYNDDSDDDIHATPIYNTFGRKALGCSLGSSHMPTMCSSYPIARELTIADFFHVDDMNVYDADSTSNDYVLVSNNACEGLFKPGKEITSLNGQPSYVPELKTTETESTMTTTTEGKEEKEEKKEEMPSEKNDNDTTTTDNSTNPFNRTVSEFLNDNNLNDRWNEQNWFMIMSKDLLPSGKIGKKLIDIISSKENATEITSSIYQWYRQALSAIWFVKYIDVDTEDMLRMKIVEATQKLIFSTIEFVDSTFDDKKMNPKNDNVAQEKGGPNEEVLKKVMTKTKATKVPRSISENSLIKKRYDALVAAL